MQSLHKALVGKPGDSRRLNRAPEVGGNIPQESTVILAPLTTSDPIFASTSGAARDGLVFRSLAQKGLIDE